MRIYETTATATHEGRNGGVSTADGLLDVRLAAPRELGGAGGATNPEQLFACGYAACFMSALQLVGREAKVRTGTPLVTARVGLDKADDGFHLGVRLEVALPDLDEAVARDLVTRAHQICPYSRATRGNVDVGVALVSWKGAPEGAERRLADA